MFGIFNKNFWRGVLCSFFSLIPAAIIVAICSSVAEENPYWILIGFFSAIPAVILFCIVWSGAYAKDLKYYKEKSKFPKPASVRLLLIHHLVAAIVALTLCVFAIVALAQGGELVLFGVTLFQDNFGLGIILALGGCIAFSQIGFYISVNVIYRKAICKSCKRMFCFERKYTGSSEVREKTQFKTSENKEQIGSVQYGNQKADVYANVRKGYSRTVSSQTQHFSCKCRNCGHVWTDSETDVRYGEWK